MTTALTTRKPANEPARDVFDTRDMVDAPAEKRALASMLDLLDRAPDQARSIADTLTAAMFCDDYTQDVFVAIRAALDGQAQAAPADVLRELEKAAAAVGIDAVDDPARGLVVDLLGTRDGTGPQAGRLGAEAAAIVVAVHERRQALATMAMATEHLRNCGNTAEALEGVSLRIERVRASMAGAPKTVPGLLSYEQSTDLYLTAKEACIPTGFLPFDQATDGGLPVGELVGIGGPPGAGKSALALQLLIGAMVQDDSVRSLWCMGEMTPAILVRRAACVGAAILGNDAVSLNEAKRRTPSALESAKVMRGVLGGGRLSVLTPQLTVDRIAAALEATRANVVVVDYLQLIQGTGADRLGDIEAAVAGLTALATNTGASIMVLTGMSKAAITGGARIGGIGKGSGQFDYAMSFVFVADFDEEAKKKARERREPFEVNWKCHKARNEDEVDFLTKFDGRHQVYRQPIDEIEALTGFAPREAQPAGMEARGTM
jgi:hypothetical protein